MRGLSLHGVRVLNLSINLPGPAAAARLHAMGADVVKVEPPGGDPLSRFVPEWYQDLCEGQFVISLDLKSASGESSLNEYLSKSDLLITASRLAALQRLGLDWVTLHNRYPDLCHVAILGSPAPKEHQPGHDLTYQAELGLIDPPQLPRTLLADLAGAERAVSAGIALLLAHARGRDASYQEVFLAEAAEFFTHPLRYGVTSHGGFLGGGLARYNLYPTKTGWIAVGALEQHFWNRLMHELGLESHNPGWEDLERVFRKETALFWEDWARARDLPIVAVKGIDGKVEVGDQI